MPGNDNGSYDAYKKFEEEWNNKFTHMANCHRFVALAEELAGQHLNQVQAQRNLIKNWLDFMGYTNKEEIANVARKYILNENKLDHLDDLVYSITQSWKTKTHSLGSLKSIMNELSMVLKTAHFENKNHKIKSLKDELNEVKSLFMK